VDGNLDTSTPAADEEKLATTPKSQEKFENIEEEKIETTTPDGELKIGVGATATTPEEKVDATTTTPRPGNAWWDGTGENDTESHEQVSFS
jgi:hypothetical protein